MDNKAILCVIAVFFAVGGIDHLIGNRLGLGSVFLETLQKMGMILLGVMGIYSLAPVAAEYVGAAVTPLADDPHTMPDVRGMGLKDALFVLESRGLKVRFSGAGAVTQQSIPAGARITPGSTVGITLK